MLKTNFSSKVDLSGFGTELFQCLSLPMWSNCVCAGTFSLYCICDYFCCGFIVENFASQSLQKFLLQYMAIIHSNQNITKIMKLKVLGKSVGGSNAKVLSYEVKWYKNCHRDPNIAKALKENIHWRKLSMIIVWEGYCYASPNQNSFVFSLFIYFHSYLS